MNTPSPLCGKHIILGISGGIAAYKSVYLLRLLRKAGAEVQVVITPAGKEFITPVTLSALTGKPVISEFFTANTGQWNSHVDLGLWADAMVIAPATASTIAKMANGVADNMLITTYLSAKEHVFVAPAMDLDMYAHPATQRNIDTLRKDGVTIIDSASGYLASGLEGKGRMEEPEGIMHAMEQYFRQTQSLKGKKILITAGPTYENIDPVRFIGNYSTGKMGFALAAQARQRGAEVILISGPVALSTPPGVQRINVTSATQMLEACRKEFSDTDVAIMCAAVADYRPAQCTDTKLKREHLPSLTLELVANPDIAAALGASKRPNQLLVGFALETVADQQALTNAVDKARRKNLDWIVLNTLNDPEAGFGKDTNKVTMLRTDPQEIVPFDSKLKTEVAADILDTVFK